MLVCGKGKDRLAGYAGDAAWENWNGGVGHGNQFSRMEQIASEQVNSQT